jgi:D-arabinose 1-dehydrogenase-like Zn-dependent alcohol dehydrogenase
MPLNYMLDCDYCYYCHCGEIVLCSTERRMALADAGANTNVLKALENIFLEFPENISIQDETFLTT